MRDAGGGEILGRETLCGSCMTIEVEFSPGMDCRVILAGKSRREKTAWWHKL